MLVMQGDCPQTGIPFVDQLMPDGSIERRLLARLPTPEKHAMMALPYWMDANPAIVPLPKAQWGNFAFNRRHTEIPILDQNGKGACEAFDWIYNMMLARARAGETYVPLSPWHLYSLINHGVDAGANAGDAVQALLTNGVCQASLVPGMPIRPYGISAAAQANAVRYKLGAAQRIPVKDGDNTIGQVLTAVVMGWNVSVDVEAGSAYNTNSNGITAFLGSRTNHAQTVGEGLEFDTAGNPYFPHRNSWNTTWGQQGFGKLTTRHILASEEIWVSKWVISDPQDPNSVPSLPAVP